MLSRALQSRQCISTMAELAQVRHCCGVRKERHTQRATRLHRVLQSLVQDFAPRQACKSYTFLSNTALMSIKFSSDCAHESLVVKLFCKPKYKLSEAKAGSFQDRTQLNWAIRALVVWTQCSRLHNEAPS
jgi:Tfp pilus assembly protein FimT